MKKIVTVVGARPQFIKVAAVSRELRTNFQSSMKEIIIHTGQHFEKNMSETFFSQLDIQEPNYNLGISGTSHGLMTGRMLESIESVLLKESPDLVLTYGDTNSTLAGALAAAKMHIPVAHVESGLRSYNMNMPEEINRVCTDKLSSILFCPTELSVMNLKKENITDGVRQVGDVMYDAAEFYKDIACEKSTILDDLILKENEYILATCHRQENTDNLEKLIQILNGIIKISNKIKVVFPIHPRTKKVINKIKNFKFSNNVLCIDPVSYLDMICLEKSAAAIFTDSGGMQKEAFFFETPCITCRDQTEWVETISLGVNTLVEPDEEKIYEAVMNFNNVSFNDSKPYGDGRASKKILEIIEEF